MGLEGRDKKLKEYEVQVIVYKMYYIYISKVNPIMNDIESELIRFYLTC